MTVHVSIPLDEADKAELERIARDENLSLEALISRLAHARLAHDKRLRSEIDKGIESARLEPLIDHDDLFDALEAEFNEEDRRR